MPPLPEAGDWIDVGAADELARTPLRELKVGGHRIALSYRDGVFGAVSGVCNHSGGPLGQGRLDRDFIVCPWHAYKFHRVTGSGEPGFEDDRVPRHEVQQAGGRVLVRAEPSSQRHKLPHAPHPLAREPVRGPGPVRVLGLATTAMNAQQPRVSTSELLLDQALAHAADTLGAATQRLALRDLSFRACEGYYSKSAHACTWPCSITQMDPDDQLDRVYEGLVHWADVVLVATPIRWGAPSSLYARLVERLNCVQNQITTHGKVLIRDKVAALIVTGGQDGVQAVAGQMLGFFAELGFVFPPFPYVAHSRGWDA
ncbi:MAG TPA: Rieske 2Fe-2S domain-containing protein, partial [Planctomycetota bacterium]|nr:Rieske 2Fe-2S domain-containing protein [Planctomycetota bacterium]